jgi:putative transposase
MKVDDSRRGSSVVGNMGKGAFVGIEAKTGYYPGMAGMSGARRVAGGRRRRILGRKGQVAHCYHLMSRTCGGEVLFDDVEKEALVKLIRKMGRFCGVQVLTFCVMGNHFHLLVRVPDRENWMTQFDGSGGEEKLLAHLSWFYSASFMQALRWQLGEDRKMGDEAGAQARLEGFKKRFCDVSSMMKELKERFSKWYNKRHGRRGTLWMDRYKSVLVEGPRTETAAQLDALRVMALYIDLNPIRAGIAEDPAGYRWSGYGEAVGGASKEAREGLTTLVGARSWKQAAETYRMWLFANAKGDDPTPADGQKKLRHGVALERRRKVLNDRGRMSIGELIRCRVRYFTDGAVIGSKAFVAEQRDGPTGAKIFAGVRRLNAIPELEKSSAIFSLRQLRLNRIVRPDV